MGIELTINGEKRSLDVPEDTPLLWAIRDHLHLTGTKFGCGMAQCGSCTVHMNGAAIRSCVTPVGSVKGQSITTIEGLESKVAKAVQESWEEEAVVQCGYCQSGQIMSAVALLQSNPKPSDSDIDSFMSGNICRCSTYVRIRAAIKSAAEKIA
ncbi:Aerobic-type carbon monoxide dehydrogenase small subunit CoxS/CutS-like protein [Hahella chejuensis KCTC 2396]|uniref:Aerobic-type carbon monoxide dehydrogenase small subunit CoxS/CutS-like protein n=1 Tax=Hahella chejuensis (strain KCTC 2396) TaxID=349521 RepID=Q2SLM8_HAHCH|nr:(2Fe-2S)-binding protein [Hahella chejuensis]ABC28446.1 Aerobic-type carbon monoxide dehydrogenase small subunit CoxS/CutS-like protein [Hahella chejuensis KCTC 2396]